MKPNTPEETQLVVQTVASCWTCLTGMKPHIGLQVLISLLVNLFKVGFQFEDDEHRDACLESMIADVRSCLADESLLVEVKRADHQKQLQ